jgi:hypothetical protein
VLRDGGVTEGEARALVDAFPRQPMVWFGSHAVSQVSSLQVSRVFSFSDFPTQFIWEILPPSLSPCERQISQLTGEALVANSKQSLQSMM